MDRRAELLIGQGLAERRGQRVIFTRDLLSNLRDRELAAVGAQLATKPPGRFRRLRRVTSRLASIVVVSRWRQDVLR